MSSPLFDSCYQQHLGSTEAVMLCVSQGLEAADARHEADMHSWLLLIAGALVFLMQLGFGKEMRRIIQLYSMESLTLNLFVAMLCAGCVRRKNVSNTLLKNVLDACGAAVAFFTVGFAFAFGGGNVDLGTTFIGHQNFFLTGDIDYGFFFYQYTFSAAAVTIIAGTLAERCRMSAYICYSIFMVGFVYPVVAHSIWSANGFLSAFAAEPFMGSGAID